MVLFAPKFILVNEVLDVLNSAGFRSLTSRLRGFKPVSGPFIIISVLLTLRRFQIYIHYWCFRESEISGFRTFTTRLTDFEPVFDKMIVTIFFSTPRRFKIYIDLVGFGGFKYCRF